MFTNVNLAAPVGALAVLGAGFLMLIAGLVFLYGLISRRLGLARLVLLAAVIGGAIYFGTLLVFSFASREEVLAPGQEKHFCEIDCHLAYSILDVRRTKTLGNAPNLATADGSFYVINMKTRFDEETISRMFDLPADVQHPALLMQEGEWLTHFVIGHENSPLHKKTRFQLGV
ncbi:MAG TPA: hypothetical protein VE135_08175 [Pyrinomonadaceae bacterium]|nr:hypothetical protein [Pyrinomonadaceae bacterium]